MTHIQSIGKSAQRATRITLIALAVPLLLALIVINLPWYTVKLVPGVAQQSEIQSSGADGTVFVAILLACAALSVVFFIVGKGLRYVLAGLQLAFAIMIIFTTMGYLDNPIHSIRADLEKLTGLTGEHAFDHIIEHETLSIWPTMMFVIAGLMILSVVAMFWLIRVMPAPTKKYDRADKPANEDNWGVTDEPEED